MAPTVRTMGKLREPGVAVRVVFEDGTDLGVLHMPPPVEEGDLVALERGLPLRVNSVKPAPRHSPFSRLVEVKRPGL